MDRSERFYMIDRLLNEHGVVTRAQFLEALEVSPATFKRDLAYMRERFNAPIEWDEDRGGYVYERARGVGPTYALPGLWFNASEIQALLTMDAMLAGPAAGASSAATSRRCARASRCCWRRAGSRRPRCASACASRRMAARRVDDARVRGRRRRDGEAAPARHRLRRPQHRRGDAAQRVAAAPRALPRQLVPRRVVPPAPRAAQVRAGCHRVGAHDRRAREGGRHEARRARARRGLRRLRRRRRASGRSCASRPPARAGWRASAGTPTSAAASSRTVATCSRCRMPTRAS